MADKVGIAIGAIGITVVAVRGFLRFRRFRERPKSDKDLVRLVLREIEGRMPDGRSLAVLSEVEADLLSTVTAMGIIGNGGHFYWYQGMKRADTLRAANGFERMGELAAAAAMRSSLDALPKDALPEDALPEDAPPEGELSVEFLRAHAEELEAAFSTYDRVLWDVAYDASAAAYIRNRRSALIAANPRLAKVLGQDARTPGR